MKRDRGHTHSVAALVLCGIASFVPGLACIGGGNGTPPVSDAGAADDGGPTTVAPPLSLPAPTANITWAPTTTLIDQTQTSLVTSVDSANQVITLDSAGVKAAGLDLSTGRILVIYGQAMQTITSSTDDGTTVTLGTGPASLAQAVTNAELDWQQAAELSPEAAQAAAAANVTNMLKKHHSGRALTVSGNHLSYDAEVGDYEYSVDMDLGGDTSTVTLSVSKDLVSGSAGSISAKISATGQISRFVNHNHVSIVNGVLQEYDTDNPDVQGSLTLSAVAAGSGGDDLSYTLPVPLFEYPIMVGPIPVLMTVGAQFVMNGQVPADGSVQVDAVINFDADLGITYGGTSVSASGSIGPYSIAKGAVTQSGSSSAVGFSGGVGFPRIGVSAFGEGLVGWIQPGFVVGGTFTFFPACQTANAQFLAACGYDISVLSDLAPDIASGETNLFESPEQVLLSAGTCDGGT
jgi:hypothetical protein